MVLKPSLLAGVLSALCLLHRAWRNGVGGSLMLRQKRGGPEGVSQKKTGRRRQAVSPCSRLCAERKEGKDRRADDDWRDGKEPAGPWGDWISFSSQEEAPEAEETVRCTY